MDLKTTYIKDLELKSANILNHNLFYTARVTPPATKCSYAVCFGDFVNTSKYTTLCADFVTSNSVYSTVSSCSAKWDIPSSLVAECSAKWDNATSAVLEGACIVYQVGAIYFSTNSTNPAEIFGFGTWSQISQGRTLLGHSSTDIIDEAGNTRSFPTVGESCGDYCVQLSASNLPSHTHGLSGKLPSDNHTHPLPTKNSNQSYVFNRCASVPGAANISTICFNENSSTNPVRWATCSTASTTATVALSNFVPYPADPTRCNQPHCNTQPYITQYIWLRTS